MRDLQKLDAVRGDLQKELAAMKKQAKERDGVTKRKVEALVAEKRELQVSFRLTGCAYVTSMHAVQEQHDLGTCCCERF